MTKFSANLGFLWTELSLPEAIRAAKRAGFDAVECHWPYEVSVDDVNEALAETGLSMLGLNTVRGNVEAGESGLAALVGREGEARAAIDQSISYAKAINAPNIHVMAGKASGSAAEKVFIENLHYATTQAAKIDKTILIEALNSHDAPGYFLQTSKQAQHIIETVAADNLKLMFDCYHIQIMEGDISRKLKELKPIIGHIQFASVPNRSEPNTGELNYKYIFELLLDLGYDTPLGAEYKPTHTTEEGLGWMQSLR